jgi:hypothetical protein
MSVTDVAQRITAERPDFELIAITDVGLPHWRLRLRCEVLARKPISPIDEIILRAVSADIRDRTDLMVMLGLDDVVLDAAVVSMLRQEWLKQRANGELELTDKGRDVEAMALQERSEERMIPLEYDGLTRRPTFLDLPLEPAQLAAAGAREIPPTPTRPPDLVELRERKPDIERLVRNLGDGRDRELDLLAVKEVARRERVYRQATALLLRARRGNDLQVAFILDDRESVVHEQAFAAAGPLDRLGLARGVRSRTRHQKLLEDEVRERHDFEREAAVRSRIAAAQRSLDEAEDDATATALEAELRAARKELRRLDVRTVQCEEHPPLLDVALRSARERLMIASPRITDAVFNRGLERAVRKLLNQDVVVRIGFGTSRDPSAGIDPGALERIDRLRRDYSTLEVRHLGPMKVSTLIRDSHFAVTTHFPLLAHRGDPERPLSDERGWLVGAADLVEAQRQHWEDVWAAHLKQPDSTAGAKRKVDPACSPEGAASCRQAAVSRSCRPEHGFGVRRPH